MFAVIEGRTLAKRVGLFAGCVMAMALVVLAQVPVLSAASAEPVAVSAQAKRKIPIYSVERTDRMVALGFNCAWGEEDVPVILDILAKEQVPVTFFVVGDWAEKYPTSCRMLFDAGHEVQSHSNRHKDMTTLTKEEIISDTEEAGRRISQITGVKPTLYRPPSGAYNDTLVETLTDLGYYTIQWDCEVLY